MWRPAGGDGAAVDEQTATRYGEVAAADPDAEQVTVGVARGVEQEAQSPLADLDRETAEHRAELGGRAGADHGAAGGLGTPGDAEEVVLDGGVQEQLGVVDDRHQRRVLGQQRRQRVRIRRPEQGQRRTDRPAASRR